MGKIQIHDDPEFAELLKEVSAETDGKISAAFVEKDYWVTHTLARLASTGLEIWFKGGTALAKGYGAVKRFSEDLDLKILGSSKTPLPAVSSWKSEKDGAIAARNAFFEALYRQIESAGLNIRLADDQDERARSVNIECVYKSVVAEKLAAPFKPFILLEIGTARVTPYLPRRISTFVHDYLERRGLLSKYVDDRPTIRCIHPLVTAIEKLDAIARYYPRENAQFQPEKFIRHYDDIASVIEYLKSGDGKGLPSPEGLDKGTTELTAKALAAEMLKSADIKALPTPDDDGLVVSDPTKRKLLEAAHAEIHPMYWGDRTTFVGACDAIRAWIAAELA